MMEVVHHIYLISDGHLIKWEWGRDEFGYKDTASGSLTTSVDNPKCTTERNKKIQLSAMNSFILGGMPPK
jgi:hypothetical protein